MGAGKSAGEGKADNVVPLFGYRSKKQRHDDFRVFIHLYIDVCSDGETRYGVIGANEENAFCLLEPMFMLGQEIVLLAAH